MFTSFGSEKYLSSSLRVLFCWLVKDDEDEASETSALIDRLREVRREFQEESEEYAKLYSDIVNSDQVGGASSQEVVCHVFGVCLPSQSASGKHNQVKTTTTTKDKKQKQKYVPLRTS